MGLNTHKEQFGNLNPINQREIQEKFAPESLGYYDYTQLNKSPEIEQGSYDDSNFLYQGRSPLDEMFANTGMPSSQYGREYMKREGVQFPFRDLSMANGGGLFPQMTPQDPLMNSFNKNPLSVLQRDNGGVTRQQYAQQYAPKTAAQALGIVDIHDEEGIMGV